MSVQQLLQVGHGHQQARRAVEAEQCYREVLRREPRNVGAMALLGALAGETGRLEMSVEWTRRALEMAPNHPSLLNNLGAVYRRMGRTAEAIAALQRSIQIEPRDPKAYYNLGICLKDAKRYTDACAAMRKALEVEPRFVEPWNNLGNIYRDWGMLEETIACYDRAIALRPEDPIHYGNRLFTLHYCPGWDAGRILEEHVKWDRKFCEPLRRNVATHGNMRDAEKRLKIGYVSPDFCNHCQSLFTIPLLEHHDRELFEIFCYSSVEKPDRVTARIRGLVDIWREVRGMSDEQVAAMVRADGIDVLVDLTMHMANNRMLMFARKPAPVQVAWLAYPGTTGCGAMDWRVTDSYLDPIDAGAEGAYSEKSWRLPETFWCYGPMMEGGIGPTVSGLPAKERGYVTFGCLNNFCKVNAGVLRVWGKAMKRVERSRLKVLAVDGAHRERTLKLLAEEGVEAGRVAFVPPVPRREYLERYHGIDIGLDTWPYNGHTTSLDSFWMGVPVVTLVGKTVVGRAGLCQLSNLGLTELIARSEEEFVEVAARLAGDLPQLEKLRGELRGRMENSALMDGVRFARNLEGAFRGIWRAWCEGR